MYYIGLLSFSEGRLIFYGKNKILIDKNFTNDIILMGNKLGEYKQMKTYLQIGSGRLLDIQVFLDDIEVYSGKTEDAPDDIKVLRYSEIEAKNGIIKYKVYSDSQ